MRVSIKWLSELMDLPVGITPQQIAEHLTMLGLEVEGIHSSANALTGVVIGNVVEVSDVPKRPQARVCRVDVGDSIATIVTTSKKVDVGHIVVVARPGAKLHGGVQVEARKVFDVQSEGMFCSERELGISDDHSEVLILSAEESKGAVPGKDAVKQLELDDTVLEISITPNRPDALSHIGVARELAAVGQGRTKFQNPNCREMSGPVHDALLVNIEARDACLRYSARVIENIQVTKSPLWLRARLHSCGIRPINNVVDVTNLVLLERGHPLHAFDFLKLAKDRGRVSLNIRFAEPEEKMTTLDGIERTLSKDDLVIADGKGAVALAGVMGGQSSQVNEDTVSVVLESAYFQPSVVRKAARRHQMNTEASYRFERGTDPNGVMAALDRAADLMVQYAGGKVRREAVDVYPKKVESSEILVRPKRLLEISGLPVEELDESRIRARFALLGIETVGRRGESLCFRVPTFRPDLTREIDLIEEAMRLIGFAKIPALATFSRRSSNGEKNDNLEQLLPIIRNSLRASGYFGAVNFSFGSPALYQLFEQSDIKLIRVQNPLGEELSAMRRWLVPGLLENVALNMRKEAKGVHLFEIGTVFLGENPSGQVPAVGALSASANHDAWANERLRVAGVRAGLIETQGFDEKERAVDFFDVKGSVENLLSQLRVDTELLADDVTFERPKSGLSFLHPGYSAEIFVRGKNIGFVGQIHPDIQAEFELKQPVFCFELDVRLLTELMAKRVTMKALPKFPSISRDVAILISTNVSAAEIAGQVKEAEKVSPLLEQFRVFDVYTGKGIPAGKKSVALSFVFRSQERTLKDEEVQVMMDSIMKRFEATLEARLR